MKKISNEVRAVRNAKRGDRNGVSFIAIAKDKQSAELFGRYICHLASAGVKKAEMTIDKTNTIYFTSKTSRHNTGRVCHHIQLKARELNVAIPMWIGYAANGYRTANKMDKLVVFKKGDNISRKDDYTAELISRVKAQTKSPAASAKVQKEPVQPKTYQAKSGPVPAVTTAVEPTVRRKYTRVPAWKKFLRWLAK